jgi:hypothetical protein
MEEQRLSRQQCGSIIVDAAGGVTSRFTRQGLPDRQYALRSGSFGFRVRPLLFRKSAIAFLKRRTFGGNGALLFLGGQLFRVTCGLLGDSSAIALTTSDTRLPCARDNTRHENHKHRHDSNDKTCVAASELLQLICRTGWPGDDRFIL